jgi:hypothetical protein
VESVRRATLAADEVLAGALWQANEDLTGVRFEWPGAQGLTFSQSANSSTSTETHVSAPSRMVARSVPGPPRKASAPSVPWTFQAMPLLLSSVLSKPEGRGRGSGHVRALLVGGGPL